ncbi:MAG: hypothetical protein O7I42_26815 [Alphaproteobacteria bacterium]|nr:hypothetical protein [Alphaproteobacteria bacterium]
MVPPWNFDTYPYEDAEACQIVNALYQLIAIEPDATDIDEASRRKVEAAFRLICEAAGTLVASFEYEFIDRLYKLPPRRLRRLREKYGHVEQIPDLATRRRELRRMAPELGGAAAWRSKLRALRDSRISFEEAIADGPAKKALRWGASQASILETVGSRWLHFLRDNGRELRKAVDTALQDKWLKGEVGSPDRHHLVTFVTRIVLVHEVLTGERLTHGIQIERKGSKNAGRTRPSKGIRFVRVCLDPIDPDRTNDAIAHLIREAYP